VANPVVTIDATQHDALGYVRLQWTNANKGANWYAWRVYRRLTGATGYTLLKEYVADVANYDFHDQSVPENTSVDYSVVRVHLVGAVPTEEAHTPTIGVTAVGSYYWIEDVVTESQSLRLSGVTADSFQKERDKEVLKLLGRGRKVDRGTTYGVEGTLSLQLRDSNGLTARQQLKKLELLAEDPDFVYLKNPFGDVYKVVIGDPSVERLSGVGLSEYVDVSLEYTEV